jgi:hypothetical protein
MGLNFFLIGKLNSIKLVQFSITFFNVDKTKSQKVLNIQVITSPKKLKNFS